MDWIYDVIESVSKTLRNKKTILVLHRSMVPSQVVKAYKLFRYNLYLTEAKNKSLILSKEYRVNCRLDDIEKEWVKQDKKFLDEFMEYILSDEFKEVRNGVQQISD